MLLDWGLVLTVLSVISILVTGAVWVMSLVNKLTTRIVSQEKDLANLSKEVNALSFTVKDHESKNSYFRHNFDPVTKSLFDKMDDLERTIKESINDGFKHVKELFDTKIQNVEGKINEKR